MKPFTLWLLNHKYEELDIPYNPNQYGVFDKHYYLVYYDGIDYLWELI